jgi:monofunctional biosynthetic peptidoglycan transglycosylase
MDIAPERRADNLAEDEEPAMPRRRKAGSLAHNAKRVALVLLVLLALPYLLIPVYALPFTRPVSTLMLSELVLLRGYDRNWVDLDEISPNLVRAVMMSEDGQFCFHGGVDWVQMRGVVQDALDGESTRGASTIPMQTVKNLFLWNGRFFVRKVLELPLAMTADFVWSKRRMMEIYLNVAEWGPGIYGAEAAAQHHFKTSAAKLSSSQAALLAVALPNPLTRVASKPGRGMRRLAGVVERRARGSGDYIKCIYE